MKTRAWIIAAVTPLALAAFGECNPPTACTLEMRVEISPTEKTIHVGESFQAKAEGVSCGGRDRFPYEAVTWLTGDDAVIQVDKQTGRITGVAPGTAHVSAQDLQNPMYPLGLVTVTVQP